VLLKKFIVAPIKASNWISCSLIDEADNGNIKTCQIQRLVNAISPTKKMYGKAIFGARILMLFKHLSDHSLSSKLSKVVNSGT
jgi:hypothetical protein